jgi:hypothetical protein
MIVSGDGDGKETPKRLLGLGGSITRACKDTFRHIHVTQTHLVATAARMRRAATHSTVPIGTAERQPR